MKNMKCDTLKFQQVFSKEDMLMYLKELLEKRQAKQKELKAIMKQVITELYDMIKEFV